MISLQGIWAGDALHVWGLNDQDASTATSGAWSVPVDVLRDGIGEGWDSLLASGANESQLALNLPDVPTAGFEDRAIERPDGDPDADSADHAVVAAGLARRVVHTLCFQPSDAVDLLTAPPRSSWRTFQLAPSFRFWSRAAWVVLELLAKQRFVPAVYRAGDSEHYGLWRVAIDDQATSDRLHVLIVSMPPVCRALADEEGVVQASELMERFLWRSVDSLVRRCLDGDELAHAIQDHAPEALTPQMRWLQSLVRPGAGMTGSPDECAATYNAVGTWLEKLKPPAAERACKTCFRLHAPEELARNVVGSEETPWRLSLHVQATSDPSLVVDAERLSANRVDQPRILPRPFDHAEAQLRADVERAVRYFPPMAAGAEPGGPVSFALTLEEAYAFLRDVAPILESEGYGVWLPAWWGRHRQRLRMSLDLRPVEEPGGPSSPNLSLEALVAYDWHVALGEGEVSLDELRRLAGAKQPLVQLRGEWTEIQQSDLEAAVAFLERQQQGHMTLFEAMRQYYMADDLDTGLPVSGLRAHGWLESILTSTDNQAAIEAIEPPETFRGSLRPYQCKGLSWLRFLSRIGVGGCLADDMGLGKTIQLLALWLYEKESGLEPGPTLLVVPTSLVGNWQREIERFAPSLRVMIHHGLERLTGEAFVDEAGGYDVVISTYALAHRDFEYLSAVPWHRIALDEAQNIKNPAAKQSVAVRSLKSVHRVALTGTPIENRLSELWSILDFLNPDYLGGAGEFRRRFAVPIERHHDADRAERLRHLIRPFVLRRLKSDPSIEVDLPEKMEMKVFCTLTREQAALYEAVVGDMLGEIDHSDGMQRRGLILAALVKLKQVCNHPVQFLADGSGLPGRSGKCDRLRDMIDEVLAEGDRALIFTQYRRMGDLLQRLLKDAFDREVLFLHGGTSRKNRDRMVERFQDPSEDAPLFLLSLKAGGFGLNLTAANHVFHFDRWWNPAVEDQATDRAHRVGQTRRVQVHKFLCMGTLEERIDALLEDKRSLAQNIVGSGEEWLTELSTDQLRDLFALSQEAVAEC